MDVPYENNLRVSPWWKPKSPVAAHTRGCPGLCDTSRRIPPTSEHRQIHILCDRSGTYELGLHQRGTRLVLELEVDDQSAGARSQLFSLLVKVRTHKTISDDCKDGPERSSGRTARVRSGASSGVRSASRCCADTGRRRVGPGGSKRAPLFRRPSTLLRPTLLSYNPPPLALPLPLSLISYAPWPLPLET